MVKGLPDQNGVITPIDFRENKHAAYEDVQFKGKVYMINVADYDYFPHDEPKD